MWKLIESLDGMYEVSDRGEVRNAKTLRLKSQGISKNGYLFVRIDHKKYAVHRLVALAFLPIEDGKNCVNHKDEDKTNNSVINLEWCDIAYNNRYGSRQKRCDLGRGKAVVGVRGAERIYFDTIADAAKALGVNPSSIRNCIHGERNVKSVKGYSWSFVNDGLTNRAAQ